METMNVSEMLKELQNKHKKKKKITIVKSRPKDDNPQRIYITRNEKQEKHKSTV